MAGTLDSLRSDAVAAFHHAVAAVHPSALIPAVVTGQPNRPMVAGRPLPEVAGRQLVVALGKAAGTLAHAWLDAFPEWPAELVVLAPHGVPITPHVAARATVLRGSHPYPDDSGATSTRRLLQMAARLGAGDLMLVLLSGGTSALLATPHQGLCLDDVSRTTRALLEAGAPIGAVNTVRRELLAAAGGGLARAAFPAQVATLIVSDVLGDSLESIGSGPTVVSSTSAADALEVLDRYQVLQVIPATVPTFLRKATRARIDKATNWPTRTSTQILANNGTAVTAAVDELRRRGYRVITATTPIEGEASIRGRELAHLALAMQPREPTAFVAGGETTVTVRGTGSGGRNQELALAAAIDLDGQKRRIALLAAGTDGMDGISEAAGGITDASTCARIRRAGLDPLTILAANDSATALAEAGDAVITGPTGTNVCDLVIITMCA